MKRRFPFRKSMMTATILVSAALASTITFAQPPPGGPGGGPGGPGGPGMGRPPFGGPRRMTVSQAPVSALAAGLKLTEDQKSKITQIHKDTQQQRQDLMPRPGDPGSGPPDPETMRAAMDKVRSLDEKADQSIEAVLTASQKQALPTVLKEIDALRATGIPAELYGDLKLTSAQKTKLTAIAQTAQQTMRQKMESARQSGDFQSVREAMQQSQQQTHDKALAVLTADQRMTVDKFLQDHPRPQRGDGFGPPPPPGPGGPPDGDGPPPGGPPQDGPPPGDR